MRGRLLAEVDIGHPQLVQHVIQHDDLIAVQISLGFFLQHAQRIDVVFGDHRFMHRFTVWTGHLPQGGQGLGSQTADQE